MQVILFEHAKTISHFLRIDAYFAHYLKTTSLFVSALCGYLLIKMFTDTR